MYNPPILGDSIEVLLEIILPNEIDDDINPFALGGCQDFFSPVLAVVIISRRRAESLRAEFYFFRRSGCYIDG